MELPIYMIGIVFLFPQQIVPFVGGFVWLQVKVGAFHKWQNTSMETTRHLVSAGTKLVIDRAAFSVAISSDLTLIGLIIGAAAGAPYGIAQRLFAIPNLILGPLSDALWPVFARADSNGDHLWLRRSFLKLIFVITVISILTVSGISIFYKSIVATWLGQVLETDWLLISGAAVLSVLHVMVHSFIMLLRSMEFSGFLARTMLAMAIVKVFFSVLLIYWIGISGAVWGSVIAYISCLLIPYSICLFRALPNTRVPANKILGAT
jgi:O-antigen/teichoic acid export membrane protein